MSEESKSVYTSYIELLRISLDAAQRIGCDMELHHGGLIKLFKEIDALQTRIAELENEHAVWLVGATNEIERLNARIAELEALVERLIELGDVINGDKDSVWTLQTIKECWTEDVTKWKERE